MSWFVTFDISAFSVVYECVLTSLSIFIRFLPAQLHLV